MQSIDRILQSPYLVLNKLAVALYKDDSAAARVRLRSRVNGTHRYTREEVKRLRQILKAFARALENRAAKLHEMATAEAITESPLKLSMHNLLQLKPMLRELEAPTGRSYQQLYDSFRLRTQPYAVELQLLADKLQGFASFINEQLDHSKTESNTYPFSTGRGRRGE